MPNPYNQNTTLTLYLENASTISIDVVDVLGRQLATLAQGEYMKGNHQFNFSAKALGYSAGMYTMRINVDGQTFNELLIETE